MQAMKSAENEEEKAMAEMITLTELCKKHRLDTKNARAILRDAFPKRRKGKRWEFSTAEARKAIAILKAA